jgi:hypothetical protein
MRKRIIRALAASWLAILSSAAHAFDVIQLTNNSIDDHGAEISGSNVVWHGSGDIYLWDGATITQITNNGSDKWPKISGSNVAWTRSDGNDKEIYFWDGSFPVVPVRITDNDTDDWAGGISGSNVVWQHCDGSTDPYDCVGGDYDIYLWNGASTTQITNNSVDDTGPAIAGSNVVWAHCEGGTKPHCTGGDTEIYLWDGVTTTRITDNSTHDVAPVISGSNVAWAGCDGGTPDTFCVNGDWEIYFWDGSFPVVPVRITDNDTDDWTGGISGAKVVWYGRDESSPYDFDIHLWEGGTITNISNNSFYDYYPDISGSKVVWDGRDGDYPVDYEIYMTTIPGPIHVPSISFSGFALLAGLVVGSVAWARRGR